MEDKEELPEEGNPTLALQRQLKTCSWVFVSMLASGMNLELDILSQIYYPGKVNAAYLEYAPKYEPLVSAIIAGFSAHFLGRRNTIIGMQLLIIFPTLVTGFTVDPFVRFNCFVLNNLGRKMVFILSPLYVSEVSQAHLRAFLVGIYYLIYFTGSIVLHYVPQIHESAFWVAMTLNAAALGLTLLAPETPHYLAMTDRVDEADELLQLLWAGTGGQEASALLDKADLYSDQFRKGISLTVMSSRFAVPLFICFTYTLADYQICHLYLKPAFKTADSYGYGEQYQDMLFLPFFNNQSLVTVLADMFKLMGLLFYLPLSFLFGRRTLFLVSLLSSLSFGFWHLLAPLGPKVLAMIYTCLMFEYNGLQQIGDTLHSEIFPAVARAPGMGVNRMFHFLIFDHKGYYRIYKPYRLKEYFSILLVICFPIGAILVFLFMPETKDLPLTETENLASRLIIQPFLAADPADEEEATDEE